jgi:hypothetical protein
LRVAGLCMRRRVAVVLFGSLVSSAPALAQQGTWVVIPGRPDVPVFVNPYGLNAAYSVVEGDFGLGRPAQVNPIIVAGPYLPVPPNMARHWFPGTGHVPGYGRYEIQPPPNRRKPPPAQTYIRSWETSSDPLPASTDPPYPMSISPVVGPYGGGRGPGPWGRGGGGRLRQR